MIEILFTVKGKWFIPTSSIADIMLNAVVESISLGREKKQKTIQNKEE
jgi:hypothetical protein